MVRKTGLGCGLGACEGDGECVVTEVEVLLVTGEEANVVGATLELQAEETLAFLDPFQRLHYLAWVVAGARVHDNVRV